jgi:major outer membrane protein
MYFLFSLCLISPLVIQAETASQVFENEEWEDEDALVDEDRNAVESFDDQFCSIDSENQEANNEIAEDISYKNTDDTSPVQNFSSEQRQNLDNQPGVKNFNLPIDHAGYFGYAEFLWWKLNETTLDYATHKNFATNAQETSSALALGHQHVVDIDYHPGFRLGLGYRFSKDLWELSGVYTYFYSKGDDDVHCGQCQFNNPALPSFIDMNVASNLNAVIEGKANLRFWYRVGDIELAKSFSFAKKTSARFIVGPTMAFIQQHFHTVSIDNTNAVSSCPAQQTKTKMDWNFSGGGIKIAVDSHWNVLERFSFLFGGHLSALYGYYINKWHANRFLLPAGPCSASTELQKNKFSNATFKDRRNIFGTRIFGGIAYNHPFKSCNLEVYINYELNTWFNLTDQYRMQGEGLSVDNIRAFSQVPLNISGIDFGLKINF